MEENRIKLLEQVIRLGGARIVAERILRLEERLEKLEERFESLEKQQKKEKN